MVHHGARLGPKSANRVSCGSPVTLAVYNSSDYGTDCGRRCIMAVASLRRRRKWAMPEWVERKADWKSVLDTCGARLRG